MFLEQINRKLERQRAARKGAGFDWVQSAVADAVAKLRVACAEPTRTVGVKVGNANHELLEKFQQTLDLRSKSKTAELAIEIGLRCMVKALLDGAETRVDAIKIVPNSGAPDGAALVVAPASDRPPHVAVLKNIGEEPNGNQT